MKKVLITDDCHPLLNDGLKNLGYQCDYQPEITPENTTNVISGYEGLIINSKIMVNQDFLDRASRLKFIGRLGSGMEIVDKEYAAKKGVLVFSSPEGNRNAVAEQALGMLLALANNLIRGDREVRLNIWEREKNRGFEIEGKTMGIIGFGHTGSQFAKKLQGLGMEILAFDKYKTSGFANEMPWVRETGQDDIIAKSDIISLHLPLTTETKHLVNESFINQCKPGFILINTSRGKCVNTEDLIAGLESKKIGGACLDVFENEKPVAYSEREKMAYQRLHQFENVILSPHVAGWTHESKYKLAAVLLEKITAAIK
jgi:D-3-phosphoglycerate dehydrogenase